MLSEAEAMPDAVRSALDTGDLGMAARHLADALASTADKAALFEACTELASRLDACMDPAAAAYWWREALRIRQDGRAWFGFGRALQRLRQTANAAIAYEEALKAATDPQLAARIAIDLSHAHLVLGNLPEAFRHYRSRFDVPGFPWTRRHTDRPEWAGEALAGRSLLIHAERDFGDTIQHLRYLPLIAKGGGQVFLECQRPLLRLAESVPGLDGVFAHGAPLPAFDCQCDLLDLPQALGMTKGSLPDRFPYLSAPQVPDLGPRNHKEIRIGIVWSGRRGDGNRDGRHCGAEDMAPLAELPGAVLHSFQIGPAREELPALTARAPVVDLAPLIGDFADTAALLMQMDAVVAVDTAVAHLAGALARPTWLLLRPAPAYRWHFHALHRPWYPSMRLFTPQGNETPFNQMVRLRDALAVEHPSMS